MRRLSFLGIGLLLATLTACGPVSAPQMSTYMIAARKPFPMPRHVKTRLTLLVSTPIASPGYKTADMIYVQVPYKLRSFSRNRWVAPPAQMLMPMLAQRLRSKGYFRAAVTPPFSGVTNFRLDTRIIMLQQEFMQPESRVRLVMQADLIKSSTSRIIASRRFTVVIKAPGNNPYAGVLAANKAARIITQQVSNFVLRRV